jgi:hypothetical protein
MKTEGSLSCSQEPATGPYSEPDESNAHPPTLFPRTEFLNIVYMKFVLQRVKLRK